MAKVCLYRCGTMNWGNEECEIGDYGNILGKQFYSVWPRGDFKLRLQNVKKQNIFQTRKRKLLFVTNQKLKMESTN